VREELIAWLTANPNIEVRMEIIRRRILFKKAEFSKIRRERESLEAFLEAEDEIRGGDLNEKAEANPFLHHYNVSKRLDYGFSKL
jgi:hypothetical protein